MSRIVWQARFQTYTKALAALLKLHPFETMLGLAMLVAGQHLFTEQGFGPDLSGSLPDWTDRVFAAYLMVGGVLVLVGIWKAGARLGTRLRILGWMLISPASLAYAVLVAVNPPPEARMYGVTLWAFLAIAGAVRLWGLYTVKGI